MWLQIVSDVSGLSQEVPAQTMGAAYGDAYLAGLATGVIASRSALDRDWVRIERRIEPDAATHDAYRALYDVYRQLHADTVADQHALARLARSAG